MRPKRQKKKQKKNPIILKQIEEQNSEEIAELVIKAQQCDEQSILKLYSKFTWLFDMFGNLIYNPRLALRYTSTMHRKFVSMFCKRTEDAYDIRAGRKRAYKKALDMLKYIRALCNKSLKSPDFMSECKLVFFEMIQTCKYPDKFRGFLLSTFHKKLARAIIRNCNDVLDHQQYDHLYIEKTTDDSGEYTDSSFAEPSYIDQHDYDKITDELVMNSQKGELDSNWINGITCDDRLKCLTSLERLELKLNFEGIDNVKKSQIIGRHHFKHASAYNKIIEKLSKQEIIPTICDCGNEIFRKLKGRVYKRCEECRNEEE